MSKPDGGSAKTPVPQAVLDHNSQVTNSNRGTSGTNIHYDTAQGHRGTQIAQNQKGGGKSK